MDYEGGHDAEAAAAAAGSDRGIGSVGSRAVEMQQHCSSNAAPVMRVIVFVVLLPPVFQASGVDKMPSTGVVLCCGRGDG